MSKRRSRDTKNWQNAGSAKPKSTKRGSALVPPWMRGKLSAGAGGGRVSKTPGHPLSKRPITLPTRVTFLDD